MRPAVRRIHSPPASLIDLICFRWSLIVETLTLDWQADAHIGVLTLNRPTALNAMNTRMIEELLQVFRTQAYNDELRCLILTAPGTRAFCTGGDLKERNGMSNEQWR